MGEAKYRKLNDPNYGKPTKMRGLILSPPATLQGQTVTFSSTGLDPQDLRSSLMYWDRLALPSNNIIEIGGDKDRDVEYLKSAGILYRPRIEFSGRVQSNDVILQTPEIALMQYEKESKGMWSLSKGKNSINNLNIQSEPGTLVEILNAVPVPGPNVPLDEILKFKAKRRDELLRYREHFEELVARVAMAEDSKRELDLVLKDVDSACSDLLRTTREWQFPIMLSSIKASLNFDLAKAVKAGVTVHSALSKSPAELPQSSTILASAGAALISQFNIKSDIGLRSIKRPASPYRYAYYVQRDLQ
ncbi:DUF6236 family protein [Pseudomonas aeruginosa]